VLVMLKQSDLRNGRIFLWSVFVVLGGVFDKLFGGGKETFGNVTAGGSSSRMTPRSRLRSEEKMTNRSFVVSTVV
jgi:hypothetical protein